MVPSGTSSLCDRLLKVFIQLPQKLCDFFTWMFNEDGTLSDAFKDEAQIIPAGTVIARMSTVVPNGWLECNGQAVSREDYPLLFATIGTTFGSGNGTTTFNVPDIRDRFIYGKGSTSNVGDTGGEEEHTLTTPEIPSGLMSGLAVTTIPTGRFAGLAHVVQDNPPVAGDDYGDVGYQGSTPVSGDGGDQPHNNIPPMIRSVFLIKT